MFITFNTAARTEPTPNEEIATANHIWLSRLLRDSLFTDPTDASAPRAARALMPMLDITPRGMANGPSGRHMHKWSVQNLAPLHAYLSPRLVQHNFDPRHSAAGEDPPPPQQRHITLAHPLSTMPESLVIKPTVWPRATPSPRVLQLLHGIKEDTPRLRPFDRAPHQRVADIERKSSYVRDYCLPAALRTGMLRTGTALPLLAASDVEVTARGSPRLNAKGGAVALPPLPVPSAGLDEAYHPSQHGVRSIIKRGLR